MPGDISDNNNDPWPSDAEIAAAEERGRMAARTEVRASQARYDRRGGKIVIALTNGCLFTFPPRLVQGLEAASDDEIAYVELLGIGSGLHWERLDVDISIAGLLAGRFGSASFMRDQAEGRSPR